jgi:hypothetical protein
MSEADGTRKGRGAAPGIIPLPGAHDVVGKAPAASRPSRLHGVAIAGMAAFAVVGILATLAFITVGWPGRIGRYVGGAIFMSVVGFLACASAAVLTAARDTYVRRPGRAVQSRPRD